MNEQITIFQRVLKRKLEQEVSVDEISFVKNIGDGFITFFVVWTIAIMLSGIVMSLFGLFFGGFLFIGVIVAFIWIVKKIIIG